MFDGEALEGFDFTARVEVHDRSWTKTLGIVDDDGNVIWLCTGDGVKAIWKRSPIKKELRGSKSAWFSGGWHRNQRPSCSATSSSRCSACPRSDARWP